MNLTVARGEFLAEEEQLRDLVQVCLFVEDGPLVLERLELISIFHGFRVKHALAARETVGPIAVGDVVGSTAESVDGAHGQALLVGEILERMIEIPGLPHGEFFAIAVGEFVKFGRRLFRPDGGVEMLERVNQFVFVAHDPDKRRTFSKGFHGGNAHRFDGVTGQRDTCPEAVKGGG